MRPLSLISLFVAVWGLCGLVAARELYVGPDQDLYDIGLALQIAQSGDEIIVQGGLSTTLVRLFCFSHATKCNDELFRALFCHFQLSLPLCWFSELTHFLCSRSSLCLYLLRIQEVCRI